MKVLSLLQPWATLVVMGHKKIETRRWQTAYRGELLIHASSGKAGGLLAKEPPFSKYISNFNQMPFGSIIGKVWLDDIVPVHQLSYPAETINRLALEERAFGDYTAGRFAWILSHPQIFKKPISAAGKLHLWDYTGPIE